QRPGGMAGPVPGGRGLARPHRPDPGGGVAVGAAATRLIEWTGERCVPWTDDVQVVYEHLGRYHFAAPVTRGRRVVDVGRREVYSAPGATPNPYHVRELTMGEFDGLLHAHFPLVAIWGQWTVSGARFEALTPPAPDGAAQSIDVGLREGGWELTGAPRPVYLLAAASRSPLPPLPGSWELRDHGLELAQVVRRQ